MNNPLKGAGFYRKVIRFKSNSSCVVTHLSA